MTLGCIAVIAQCSPLARRGVQQGLVAPASDVTLPADCIEQPLGAGRFGPIAASFVDHYALAWLSPQSLHWAQIGSVPAVQPNVIWL